MGVMDCTPRPDSHIYDAGVIDPKKIQLQALIGRLNADDYPIANLPADLNICFTLIADVLDVTDAFGLAVDVQSASKAFLEHLEPLNEELKHLGEMAL